MPKNGREYDGKNEQKCHVEAGADDGADVEIAAAAAAFGVRRHAHGDACACGGRTRVAMCCAVRVQLGCSRACESHRNERRFEFLVRAFHPGMKKTATRDKRLPLLNPFVRSMAYSTRLCDVYT